MRLALAFLLCAHGVAHMPGCLVGLGLASFPELPFSTTVFGTMDLGTTGARLVGVAWGLASIVFVALGVALAFGNEPPSPLLALALGFSALLCVSAWPKAWLGFVANTVIAALLVAGERYGKI